MFHVTPVPGTVHPVPIPPLYIAMMVEVESQLPVPSVYFPDAALSSEETQARANDVPSPLDTTLPLLPYLFGDITSSKVGRVEVTMDQCDGQDPKTSLNGFVVLYVVGHSDTWFFQYPGLLPAETWLTFLPLRLADVAIEAVKTLAPPAVQ